MGCVASSEDGGGGGAESKFYKILDNFHTVDQVVSALRSEGLESSNLIVAVDFTKSNEWTGRRSFGGRCLHDGSSGFPGPYEEVIRIIGQTLSHFDDDNLIPCYGFGDVTTADHSVFSFFPQDAPCRGMEEATQRYRALVPHVQLAGPTSFAPAIQSAMKIVAESGNKYHILLIIADGQVTRPSGTKGLSRHEQETVNAIVAASHLPLSIVMVGVGDGPWDMMQSFDDMLPSRRFDNFQFVNFTDIRQRYVEDTARMEAVFALSALMEIPEQFKIIQRLSLLGAAQSRLPASMRNFRILEPPPVPDWGQHVPPIGAAPMPPGAPVASYPMPGAQQGSMPTNQQYMPPDQQYGPTLVAGMPPTGVAPPPHGALPFSQGGSARYAHDPLFLCPISHEMMNDPVLLEDGHTYERAVIEKWLSEHDTSPMTNQQLGSKTLVPNHALRSAIMEMRQQASTAAVKAP